MLSLNKVYCNDYRDIIKNIPDKSIDLVITDPPWTTTGISFDKEVYDPLFCYKEIYRILKDRGTFIIFCPVELGVFIEQYCNFKYRYNYIWVKHCSLPQHPNSVKPRQQHELLFVYCKKDLVRVSDVTYNRVNAMTYGGEPKTFDRSHDRSKTEFMEAQRLTEVLNYLGNIDRLDGSRLGTTILNFKSKSGLSVDEKSLHPTQKPLDLIKYLIKIHSNQNDIIFDPFAGSGVAGIASVQTGRKFLLIEKDETYYQEIEKRIQLEISNVNAIKDMLTDDMKLDLGSSIGMEHEKDKFNLRNSLKMYKNFPQSML